MKEAIDILIGPEGSGKSDNAERLALDLHVPYLTCGGAIRYIAQNDQGPLGDECRDMFAKHTYLSGEKLLEILANRFSTDDVKHGFVLDGALRTIEETMGFPHMLERARLTVPVEVVYLQIPEEVSFKRCLDRNRDDDTPKGIASRLAMFNLNLDKRLEFIRNQPGWRLVEIDATPPFEVVYERIRGILS